MWINTLATIAVPVLVLVATGPTVAQQVLRVGTSSDSPPFAFVAQPGGTPEGFMVDMMNAVAADAGFSVEYTAMGSPELLPQLIGDQIDVIASAFRATPERLEQAAFGDPVFTYGEAVIVPKSDTRDYHTWEDLRGEVIGAGTAIAPIAAESGLFREVRQLRGTGALQAVANGEIEALIFSAASGGYRLSILGQFPELRFDKLDEPRTIASTSFVTRKNETELLAHLNASLAKLKTDGTLASILAEWGLYWPGGD